MKTPILTNQKSRKRDFARLFFKKNFCLPWKNADFKESKN